MNDLTAMLVRIAVALGSDDRDGLIAALTAAHSEAGPGMSPGDNASDPDASQASRVTHAVEEVLLQSYLFVGYPRVLNAFRQWRALVPAAPAAVRDDAEWETRGRKVLSRVYGGQDSKVVENVEALHPDLARWMVVEGYGKVLGREGIELGVRELCIVALLATQDAVPQLYSHLRGALNAGMTESEVEETLALALARVPGERSMRAREAWETVRSRRGG